MFRARKQSLELAQIEQSQSSTSINAVDGVLKPVQRRVVIAKEPSSRFGADLCKIGGRVFVLKVDEVKSLGLYSEYLPAMRAGLSRFDEVLQLEETNIESFSLPMIYQYLQESKRAVITVADAPLVQRCHINSAEEAIALKAALGTIASNTNVVYIEHSGSVIPKGEALVEVNGALVLGMTQHQLEAVLDYQCFKSRGQFSVSTLPLEVAAAFLTAYVATAKVPDVKDWKADSVLRRSQRHSKRRNSLLGASSSLLTSKFPPLNVPSSFEHETFSPGQAMVAQ